MCLILKNVPASEKSVESAPIYTFPFWAIQKSIPFELLSIKNNPLNWACSGVIPYLLPSAKVASTSGPLTFSTVVWVDFCLKFVHVSESWAVVKSPLPSNI